MDEIGTVTALNPRRKTAKVEFPRQSACDKCGMCAKHKDNMTVYMDVKNDIDAKVGDKVVVTMASGYVLKATFIVYVVPIILVALVLVFARPLHELIQTALCVGALAVGVVIAWWADKQLKKKKGFIPKMELYKPKEEIQFDEREPFDN